MSPYPISKVFHFIWFQGFNAIPPYMADIPRQWGQLNPDYEILRWDFDNGSAFIRDYYPGFYDTFNRLPRIIKKCDLLRLCLVHHFGGVYLDCDLIPQQPLATLLESKIRYCQKTTMTRVLPEPYPQDECDFSTQELILSREHRQIDSMGFGVANGVILARPQCSLLLEFLKARYQDVDAPVLDYLGPHALTRFIRQHSRRLHGKVAVVSPHYFLWEDHAMDHACPFWTISRHMAQNHWGDAQREDWWNVR